MILATYFNIIEIVTIATMESPEPAEDQYSNSGKTSPRAVPNRAVDNNSPDEGENYWQKADENALVDEVNLHSQ